MSQKEEALRAEITNIETSIAEGQKRLSMLLDEVKKTTVAELIADNERRLVALTAPPPEPIECLGGAVLDNE
jgi:hypothetical protein